MPLARVLRVVAVNVALTAALLLAVEGMVRLAQPEIGPAGMDAGLVAPERYGQTAGLRPGASGDVFGARVTVDAEGFVAYAEGPRDGPMWLLLGDSVTLGIGVPPDATFAGLLAAAVDTAAVRNPSVPGYAAADYVAVLRALAARPDLDLRRATVVWCLNDAYPPGTGDAGAGTRRLAGPLLGFLQRHVRTYGWAKATFADRPRTYLLHDLPHYAGEAFAHADRQLGALRALADSAGIWLDLVVVPYEPQLRPGAEPAHLLPQRRLADAADRHGIPLHDATEAFRQTGHPAALYRYGDGIHLSERGHALLAEWLLTRLCSGEDGKRGGQPSPLAPAAHAERRDQSAETRAQRPEGRGQRAEGRDQRAGCRSEASARTVLRLVERRSLSPPLAAPTAATLCPQGGRALLARAPPPLFHPSPSYFFGAYPTAASARRSSTRSTAARRSTASPSAASTAPRSLTHLRTFSGRAP